MTENKHESEETVEDTTARVEAATDTDADTETPGKHAVADETARSTRPPRPRRSKAPRPMSTNALNPSARPIGRG